MMRALFTLAAVVAALSGTAQADPPDDMRYRGLCGFHKHDDPANPPGTKAAYVYGFGAAYSVWYPHDPIEITRLVCTLVANGQPVGTATGGGDAPAAVAAPARADYPAGAVLTTCETVEIVDAHGQERSWSNCPPPPRPVVVPPDELREAEQRYVDPVLCPTLAEVAPSPVPGVTVGPDGDLTVFGAPVWRCPPYAS